MAPPYNTIPATAEEQDPLLAKKDASTLKGLVAVSALVSLALGALAATALKMPPAGAAPAMLKGDPDCNGGNAPADWSKLSDKLNDAMDKDDGFIFRYRFDGQVPCEETNFDCGNTACKDDKCGVAATLLSNKAHTENPIFCITNAHGCDSPSVGYALLDHWSMKGGDLEGYALCGSQQCVGCIRYRHAIEQASRRWRGTRRGDSGRTRRKFEFRTGYAYFPTDANSVDQRDWKKNGLPGRGCHQDQIYLQVDDKHWVTYDSEGNSPTGQPFFCKCDYDNFDPNSFGDYIVNNLGGGQPSYMGQDYSVCWLEESDPLDKLFEMQNSIYKKRGSWWNGAVGANDKPGQVPGEGYQGWNEVAFDAGMDLQKNADKLEALVVAMPDGFDNLCNFKKDIAQEVDEALNMYWTDGYGHLPVVILKNTKEKGKFVKNTFRQTFYFASGGASKTAVTETIATTSKPTACVSYDDVVEAPSLSLLSKYLGTQLISPLPRSATRRPPPTPPSNWPIAEKLLSGVVEWGGRGGGGLG